MSAERCSSCNFGLLVRDPDMGLYWTCECAFEAALEKVMKEEAARSQVVIDAEAQDYEDSVYRGPRMTRCWSCTSITYFPRLMENNDGVYGHFCPNCQESLRKHPYYGEGMPGDMANRWRVVEPQEK